MTDPRIALLRRAGRAYAATARAHEQLAELSAGELKRLHLQLAGDQADLSERAYQAARDIEAIHAREELANRSTDHD